MNIKKTNLNLLIALDALLTEQNVSRAAQKIFITQPAMSNALTQLRELFKDRLLVRDGKTMAPTPFALEIAPAIRQILQQIEDTISVTRSFNPKTAARVFRIAMSDYAEFVLLPHLAEKLMQQAPNIKLQVIHANMLDNPQLFSEGKVDLGIGIVNFQAPAICVEKLFVEEAVCVARKGHPALKNITQKKYLAAKHLAINYEDMPLATLTDKTLKTLGVARDVAIAIPHITSALHILAKTSLLSTVPKRIALSLKKTLDLDVQKPPFAIANVTVSMAWHQRFNTDAGHQWLRGLLKDIGDTI